MSKKQYYIPGIDEINQAVETPASKEWTEKKRYIINTAISVISAVAAAVIAAIASVIACFGK